MNLLTQMTGRLQRLVISIYKDDYSPTSLWYRILFLYRTEDLSFILSLINEFALDWLNSTEGVKASAWLKLPNKKKFATLFNISQT